MIELAKDKILSCEIINVFWSHNMDILALINKNNDLDVYRISYTI